jgi:acid phosphatase
MLPAARRTGWLAVLLASILLLFAYGAFGLTARPTVAGSPASPVPAFKHIFVIVLENKAYDQVVANSQASYLNKLAHQYALADNYYAISHPSLPNYLALTGGDTFGVTSDCIGCFIAAPNLVDQLEQAGKSWKAYQEAMPSPCFVGDAPPLYRQKHNPFIYYDDVRTNPARCNKIVPFDQFSADLQSNALPDFVWITPNMCDDAHDCRIGAADTWLKQWVPAILGSPAWQDHGALFITFDEGSSDDTGICCQQARGGQIATLVISPLVQPGFRSQVAYDHYALLRTIESAWGLPPLGKANCDCSPTMADFFRPAPARR